MIARILSKTSPFISGIPLVGNRSFSKLLNTPFAFLESQELGLFVQPFVKGGEETFAQEKGVGLRGKEVVGPAEPSDSP